ncbi:MAG: 4-hydroxybenzoate octaprenyltransferase [Cellvibrionaceae bacterium]
MTKTNNPTPPRQLGSGPSRFKSFWQLMRFDKPIGTLLLLWPTLWALWIAGEGKPDIKVVVIFVLGTVVMRAAGCVINDYADRNIDGNVARTRRRPLATGTISAKEALVLFVVLCAIAFGLVLFTNSLTIKLSLGGVVLAICYPFMKRFTFLPQVVLGAAFSWGIPMVFTAQTNELPSSLWLIYIANLLWTVVYDTFYAMVDRKDDVKIGVKSTAILFGSNDRLITGVLQVMTILSLVMVATRFSLGLYFYGGLVAASLLFWYQQWLIKYRDPQDCFRAFLNNQWVGCVIFIGILLHYLLG